MNVAEEWTSTVVLGDGDTAVIRPISPTDQAALAEFHVAQAPDSRYMRFFSPKPTLSDDELERFTTVDFVDRAAFVVETHGEFIAWASYERWKKRDDAEVAFMVSDRHQGKGIATLLLEHLAAIARANGISRFTAQTLGENRGMLAVFAKAGWPLQRRFDSGVIDVDFALEDTAEFIDSVERREQRADSRAIARILLASSIAVVGASDTAGSVGNSLWRHASSDDRHRVYPVNPNRATVGGVMAYPTVADIPDEVGLALIAVPAEALRAAIDDCIERRVRGAVVVTVVDGTDIDGDELVAHARRNGLRIIGPGSMGIASPLPEMPLQAALVAVHLPPGKVAISMQSGTLGGSLLRLAGQLQLGLSWFVSLGDKSDVSGNDLLQFWEDDDATSVIAFYTESFGNPRKFARIARRVSTTRPIVALRGGAALVGLGNEALYRETGVIEVPTVPALLDTARVLVHQPLMAGNRVAVLSNSRSPGAAAGSTLAAAGLELATTPRSLDWRSEADDYRDALRSALSSDGVDAVIVIHAPAVTAAVGAPIDAIEEGADGAAKPVVAVMLGSGDGPLRPGSTIASFAFPEQAAAVLGRLAAYSRWRTEEADDGDAEAPAEIDPDAAHRMIEQHLDEGRLTPLAIGELLASYSVEMTPTRLVHPASAGEAAAQLGFPVAVKALRRRIGRSAEAGIALDLTDEADVESAVATMCEHLDDDAALVYVQKMAPPGIDLRIKILNDPRVGPVVTVGLGGVQADLIADESSRLAPIGSGAARAMIESTRAAGALADIDVEAFGDVLIRVAQLASDHPEISDLDLNPVIVTQGTCIVIDASIDVQPVTRPEHAVRRLEDD